MREHGGERVPGNSRHPFGAFPTATQTEGKPRRRLNRMVGGDITVPVPRTNKEIKKTLKV